MRLSRVADLSGMPPASAPAMLSAMAWPALTLIPAPMPPACVSRHRIHRFKTFTNPVALHILLGFNGLIPAALCSDRLRHRDPLAARRSRGR
jgi:hypothetical protein